MDSILVSYNDLYDLYYNENLSLAEIAEEIGITRQAVRDILKKGETTIELEKIRMDNSFGNNVLKYIKDLGLGLTPMSK